MPRIRVLTEGLERSPYSLEVVEMQRCTLRRLIEMIVPKLPEQGVSYILFSFPGGEPLLVSRMIEGRLQIVEDSVMQITGDMLQALVITVSMHPQTQLLAVPSPAAVSGTSRTQSSGNGNKRRKIKSEEHDEAKDVISLLSSEDERPEEPSSANTHPRAKYDAQARADNKSNKGSKKKKGKVLTVGDAEREGLLASELHIGWTTIGSLWELFLKEGNQVQIDFVRSRRWIGAEYLASCIKMLLADPN